MPQMWAWAGPSARRTRYYCATCPTRYPKQRPRPVARPGDKCSRCQTRRG